MKVSSLIRISLIVALFASIPSEALAETSPNVAPHINPFGALYRKTQDLVAKATQPLRGNIILVSSQEYVEAEQNGINIDDLKQMKAIEFCQAKGYYGVKSVEYSESTQPIFAQGYSNARGIFEETVTPVKRKAYVWYRSDIGKQVITKADYDVKATQHRPGEVNTSIGQEDLPAPHIYTNQLVCNEFDPSQAANQIAVNTVQASQGPSTTPTNHVSVNPGVGQTFPNNILYAGQYSIVTAVSSVGAPQREWWDNGYDFETDPQGLFMRVPRTSKQPQDDELIVALQKISNKIKKQKLAMKSQFEAVNQRLDAAKIPQLSGNTPAPTQASTSSAGI
jgi:hypothetical protein